MKKIISSLILLAMLLSAVSGVAESSPDNISIDENGFTILHLNEVLDLGFAKLTIKNADINRLIRDIFN